MLPLLSSPQFRESYFQHAKDFLARLTNQISILAIAALSGFCCLLAYRCLQGFSKRKLLILHFDINLTLVDDDATKNHLPKEYMSFLTLAKTIKKKWTDCCFEPISFKEHVDEHLYQGRRNDPSLKTEREQKILGFLGEFEPLHPELKTEFEKLQTAKEALQKTGKAVFPSFYHLIDRLQAEKIPFKIIFRSFGKDWERVKKEIEDHPFGIKVEKSAYFTQGKLIEQNGSTFSSMAAIFKAFVSNREHLSIRDDYEHWHNNNESGKGGKPFPYEDPENPNSTTLSLFFDDNITGKGLEEREIVCPYAVQGGQPLSTHDLIEKKLLHPVNPIEAITQEEYFSDKVFSAIEKHHFLEKQNIFSLFTLKHA